MRPFFVVEHEGVAGGRPERECAARNRGIAVQRARNRQPLGRRPLRLEYRRRIGQGLTRPGESLVMHVFVENGELI